MISTHAPTFSLGVVRNYKNFWRIMEMFHVVIQKVKNENCFVVFTLQGFFN